MSVEGRSLVTKAHISLYWKCQVIGWSLAALYWGFQGWMGQGFRPELGALLFISDVVMYIFITHLYRNYVRRQHWQDLPLQRLARRIILAALLLGIVYMVVTVLRIYAFRKMFVADDKQGLLAFTRVNGINIFMAGIRLMSIWLLAYHLYQYAQREIRLVRENAQLELNFKQAQLDNLSAQLNPHLLFNSLNTIKSLIRTEPLSARRGIDLLSELLRNGLYKGPSLLVPVREEMDLVKDYLELEQLRMEERLVYEIAVDEKLWMTPVPRMSIQILVENAVKHGIARQTDGGAIGISISKKDDLLWICIQNPGVLDLSAASPGIGLANIRQRLQLAYHGKAFLEIGQPSDGLVCSSIYIPLS